MPQSSHHNWTISSVKSGHLTSVICGQPTSVLTPDEGLDLQMLFERLEQEFDLPALPIDGGNGTGSQMHEVGQEGEPSLLLLIPDDHLPQGDRTPVGRMRTGQTNHLIDQHRTACRHGALLQNFIEHVGAWPCDKSYRADRPAMIQGIVEIAAIDRHDGAWCKGELLGDAHIVGVTISHEGPAGQTALMIQLQMEFHGALAPLESGPIEHRGTELNDRGVEGSHGVLEPEPPTFQGRDGLATAEDVIEEGLVQLPGPMGIGIGQRGPRRRPTDAEVDQLPESGVQAAADFAQRACAAHLTKEHGHEMIPAAEPLGRSLSGVLPDGTREVRAIDQGENLRKATGDSDHTAPPACG